MLVPRSHQEDATLILNNLLKEYDKTLRPDIGGKDQEWRRRSWRLVWLEEKLWCCCPGTGSVPELSMVLKLVVLLWGWEDDIPFPSLSIILKLGFFSYAVTDLVDLGCWDLCKSILSVGNFIYSVGNKNYRDVWILSIYIIYMTNSYLCFYQEFNSKWTGNKMCPLLGFLANYLQS